MSHMTNDPQSSITANLALSKLARNQAMIDRALRPWPRDRIESFRRSRRARRFRTAPR